MAVHFIPFTFQNLNTCFLSYFFISLPLSSLSLYVPSSSYTMSTGENPSPKKRKNKSKNPPGPDQAVIGWREEEFQNLVRDMGFRIRVGCSVSDSQLHRFRRSSRIYNIVCGLFSGG
ncbi:hypothetical protein Hanom_Chr02g00115761 [Helianthus anomalus]